MKTIVRGALLFDAVPHEPLSTTAKTIARRLGVTERTAQRHLEALRDAGLVVREGRTNGPDQSRWWRA